MLVQSAGRACRTEFIEILIDDMIQIGIERPLALYETAMKILAAQKCYTEALSVCSRLEADGLVPSPTTLSCLINFAAESGDSERAINLFERLAAIETPSIRAYMTVFKMYYKVPDWTKSVSLLRNMQQRNAPIDSLVLNNVLATGVAAGKLDEACELLKEFARMRLVDTVSYNTVMKGYAQLRELNKAIKLIDDMCESDVEAVKPNTITFNTAIDAAIRSAYVEDAWKVLGRMRDAGLAPDKFTCTTLIKGLQMGATATQLTLILDLLRNVDTDSDPTLCSFLFRNVLDAAARVNDPVLSKRAVAQMKEQQVMLAPEEYRKFLHILMRDEATKPITKGCGSSMRLSAQFSSLDAARAAKVC